MATANEILATMAEEAAANEQAVEVCTIDRCTRAVAIPEALRIVGVESDNNVTRRVFKVACAYRGTDLSTFGIRINFMNANQEKDVYIVTDARREGDHLVFTWVLSRKALRYKGKLQFIACMVCDGGTDDEREWNSTLGEFSVLEGLEVELTGGEVYQTRDVLDQLLALVVDQKDEALAAVSAAGAAQERVIEAKGAEILAIIPEDYTALSNDVAALTEDIGNLNYPITYIENQYVNINGVVATHGDYITTDYIPLESALKIKYSGIAVSPNCAVIYQFDKNKAPVKPLLIGEGTSTPLAGEVLAVGEGYVVVSKYIKNEATIEAATNDVLKNKVEISNLKLTSEGLPYTLSSGYVNAAGLQSHDQYSCTDFIDIGGYTEITFPMYFSSGARAVVYDSNKNVIGEEKIEF